ncbi:MAG: EscV/YscV/HrcV family type III secretion system export apparatus protein, partial [Mesorhizobium sp.]
AAVFAAVSIVKADVLGAGTADAKDGTAAEPKQAAPAKEFPIAFFLAPNLMQAIDQAELQKHIGRVSLLVTADLGIIVPRIPVLVDEQLPTSQFRIDVEGVPVEQDAIDPSQMTLR